MRVEQLSIDGFRGFDVVVVRPRNHVALVGEPRAGRSDVIAALERVLQVEATRWQVREWDFHAGDLDREIRIEVTLTDLDEGLRQRFLRRLEPWDSATGAIVETSDVDDEAASYQPALRLRWTCTWDRIEERGEQRVEYVKRVANSGANANRVAREDRAALPFKAIRQREPLAVRSEGDFRAMLESGDNEDVLDAVRRLAEGVDSLSADLSADPGIVAGLERVLESLREPLGLGSDASEIIRFLPEGGAVSGLLRTLTAALDLGDGAGHLPLTRHGSTTRSLLSTSEAIWWANSDRAVVVVDDFGDGLDGPTSTRLADLFRKNVGQAWVSTRRPEVARSFAVDDLVRLTGQGVERACHQVDRPKDKTARGAMRHFQLQLLPAMTARAIVVCEGPHDVASFNSVARRREAVDGTPPPLAHRIEFVDGGGKDQMWKVAAFARRLGFSTVGILDWDRDDGEAETALQLVGANCDSVVRLPLGNAIERALIDGVSDFDLAATLTAVQTGFELKIPSPEGMDRAQLEHHALSHILKSGSGGLHQAYVDALPAGVVPGLIVQVLSSVTSSVLSGSNGLQQL